jgi:hypothetical protein
VSSIIELKNRLPVIVTSDTLPKGVSETNRRGTALAWWIVEDARCSWLVVFDETGELVWVPMKEIKLQANWTDGRRYGVAQ